MKTTKTTKDIEEENELQRARDRRAGSARFVIAPNARTKQVREARMKFLSVLINRAIDIMEEDG